MRGPGEILLLSCYELGHQPLGLASPLGFLERAGFHPAALDLSVERLDEAAVRRARLVAVSVPMHTALRLGLEVVRRVRALAPTARLVAYGLYAPLNEALLVREGADAVLGGEHEEALVALAEQLDAGPSLLTPPSLSSLSSLSSPPPPVTLRRLAFAPPSRDALPPLSRYARLVDGRSDEGRLAGYTEASRGCLHLCRHCPIPPVYGGRFFVVPEAIVVEDARRQVAAGATHITLGDPDFLNGPGHALAVLRALHEALPSVTFDATIKVEHLLEHQALLPEMARLGLIFIVSAVESLSDRVLEILDKGHTRADVATALALVRAARISLRPSLVPFTPWSTLDDFVELCDFLEASDLVDAVDPVQLSIRLLLPPGSLLLAREELAPHLGALAEAQLTWLWRHPDRRMDELQARVASLVEAAAQAEEDPRLTFHHVKQLAHALAGRLPRSIPPSLMGDRPPRLSESWFC